MSLARFRKKFIGDRAFYKMFLLLVVPMIIQNSITNFVNLLDNIMVGRLGTEPMSGVAIANQLIFVFNLSIFGGIAGAGIFGAQFFGKGDHDGVRHTFRFKLIVCLALAAIFITVFALFDEQLISLYLHDAGDGGDLMMTLQEGKKYLKIILFGLLPFAVNNAYVGTLRETGETVLPMKAGVTAVLVNLCFNWLLIFGHLGFPRLGVQGAAIATVLSRYVELAIVVWWTHGHKERNRFAVGLYKGFSVPGELAGRIIQKGWPLLLNEFMFSLGLTVINQCYSTRGLAAVAAVNISAVLSQLFRVVVFAGGSAISILVGNRLGAGRMEEAKDVDNKLFFVTVASSTAVGIVLFMLAPLFPQMYNTTDEVRALATSFLRIAACFFPVMAFNNNCYFTLRAGGKTFITFLFDSMFIWAIILPPTFAVSRLTAMPVTAMYLLVNSLELIKSAGGFFLVRSGTWISNIVTK